MSIVDPADSTLILPATEQDRRRHGIPTPDEFAVRNRAFERVEQVLGDMLGLGGLRVSPLGPGWSSDVDAHLGTAPRLARLAAAGWIPLDDVHTRIGAHARGRWAVTDGGRVVGAVDLHVSGLPDPVQATLRRCRRRGEVRVREVLELRAFLRAGRMLPDDPVVALAAELESAAGGTMLRPWLAARPPRLRFALRRLLNRLTRVRRLLRPRLRVAISGVDGAGKSTLVAELTEDLRRAGVPVSVVWARPGLRLDALEPLVRLVKRLVGQDQTPGMARVAEDAGAAMPSRRGLLGWTWAMVVVLAFLWDVRRRDVRAEGIVVYDRHLLDALATLEALYGGVDLRAHRALVSALLPRADVTFLLEVPANVAVRRKPGDLVGPSAVERQLAVYARERDGIPGLEILDGRSGSNPAHVRQLVLCGATSASGKLGRDDAARRSAPARPSA